MLQKALNDATSIDVSCHGLGLVLDHGYGVAGCDLIGSHLAVIQGQPLRSKCLPITITLERPGNESDDNDQCF